MPIRILSDEVASQIAAGEVIERPASVVKELIENSLDAEATRISIIVLEAGRGRIEVTDDGYGIPSDELQLAIERHATSKLESADDLFKISTLGFRGEALASIGSVSRMSLTSRSRQAEFGSSLLVEGGNVHSIQTIGTPIGTSVRVENLFFNVPARLKFLKSDATERRVINQLITRYALAYPGIRFHLKFEEREVLQTSGNNNRKEVLGLLYGPDLAHQMIDVLYRETPVRIEGFISPISITRSHRREILFFVNGRPVHDVSLVSALLKGYQHLLMVGRYPIAVIFVNIPPESVDVNVHPTKAEVRFREPDRIFSGVQGAVKRALLAHNPVPSLADRMMWTSRSDIQSSDLSTDSIWRTRLPPSDGPLNRSLFGEDAPQAPGTDNDFESSRDADQHRLSGAHVPILRLIGQIASAFLVAEGPDGLYLIDQHAAHERVLFEKFMSQMKKDVHSQLLLQAVPVELSVVQSHILEDILPMLKNIGFEIDPFGPQTFIIRSLPDIVSNSDPITLLKSLVDNFEEDETPLGDHPEARLIARICKRSAVKAGMELSTIEQKGLIEDLENCESPRTCPHGRPTMIHLSVDLLERQFGRRGAR